MLLPSVTYILAITPYTQKSSNYSIKFIDENTLDKFELYYKNKRVNIKYKVDSIGKITFIDNMNKLNCVSYEDGSKMAHITKYKIINYFSKWLADNNLISKEVTVTFEK